MGFRRIFWGFIFMFDFRINGFDILPDIVGYILILYGLSLLAHINRQFEAARKLSIPLIVLSLFDIYQASIPLNDFSLTPNMLIILGLGLLNVMINILMIHNLCLGIEEIAQISGKIELVSLAKGRWNLYLLLQIVSVVSFIFIFILPMLVLVLWIFSFVVTISMLNLMKICEKEFKGA